MELRDEVIYKVKSIEKIANMIIKKNIGPRHYIGGTLVMEEGIKEDDIIYYYFDNDGIYKRSINVSKGLWVPDINKNTDLHTAWRIPVYYILEPPYNNPSLLCQTILCDYMKPGMSIKEFEHLLNNHKYDVYYRSGKPSNDILFYGIERDITKVDRPIYRSSNGNTNKSFDYILVDMNIRTGIENKREFIISNKKALIQKAIERIENDRSFKKYKVPIGVLKLSKILRVEEATVEFIFELKDELREMGEIRNG